ncbi:MAG: hypothetical protein KatS3mg131_1330 [Candidatus Tectimicrobiota bacterium]|nr:MAG: hypothetical protein KatS3mg131_1330 [Candidatus Tectomicrobia bacterium]
MAVSTVRVLVPVAAPRPHQLPLAPRLRELRGKRLGLLDNTKPNADVLLHHLAALLCRHDGVNTVVHRRKAHAATGADETTLAELAAACDAVLLASGD